MADSAETKRKKQLAAKRRVCAQLIEDLENREQAIANDPRRRQTIREYIKQAHKLRFSDEWLGNDNATIETIETVGKRCRAIRQSASWI